ncbi:MAG TPA: GDP-L-fucose synthase [Candidatus Binatia bacterium]|nr:GDP-L-fucose synthase [Candidatus Binatia bacterium]
MSDAPGLPRDARIHVAGHRGMVGSAIVRRLQADGFTNLVLRTRAETDLRDRTAVRELFAREQPQYVFVAAARVGGILANDTYRADFIHDNLAIQLNVLDEAHRAGVRRLLFLGSSCIYPKLAPQPMKEEHLLTGILETTNRPYAIAKIAGIEMCDAYHRQHGSDFRAAMPTNLYGPGDNFDLQTSHVIPALIRKFHEAAESRAPTVTIWGTGTPRREFLHVDDLADACVHLMQLPRAAWDAGVPATHVNVGTGSDVTIRELAERIGAIARFRGELRFDPGKPDGTPRKLLDCSRVQALGWTPRITLDDGLRSTVAWFREHAARDAARAAN